MPSLFKVGDKVRKSGIYSVEHDGKHADAHDVTCIAGKKFPACNECGELAKFVLVRHAKDVNRHENFAP
jgi:hypothetical protein